MAKCSGGELATRPLKLVVMRWACDASADRSRSCARIPIH
jgi:hypothetical protein